jgi:uncharacterized protein YjiS (DUF1127 family)
MSINNAIGPRPGIAAALGHHARAWLERRRRAAEVRKSVRTLYHLDDHRLRDIGLSRGDVKFGVRNGRSGL